MKRLHNYQEKFYEALFNNQPDILEEEIGTLENMRERFVVYRDNVCASLKEVLRGDFPRSEAVLGKDIFNRTAFQFVCHTPPQHRCLHHYGEGFPHVLGAYGHATPCIQDVANIEWAQKKAYYSSDAEPLDCTLLEGLKPEAYLSLQFHFSPGTFFLKSPFNLQPLWEIPVDKLSDSWVPESGPSYCFIYRHEYNVEIDWIPEDRFQFLKALYEGKSLEEAYEATLKTNPKFDLTSALQHSFHKYHFIDHAG